MVPEEVGNKLCTMSDLLVNNDNVETDVTSCSGRNEPPQRGNAPPRPGGPPGMPQGE